MDGARINRRTVAIMLKAAGAAKRSRRASLEMDRTCVVTSLKQSCMLRAFRVEPSREERCDRSMSVVCPLIG